MEPEELNGDGLGELQRIIDRTRRLVFFGGAGVSTASGIPDFRSAQGLYRQDAEGPEGPDPEMILSKYYFVLQPESFFDYYRKWLVFPDARPNAAHRWLYEMERLDRLRGVVTQNVDGLHRMAGSRRLYEIHGSIHENACMDCGRSYPLSKVLSCGGVPRCDACGGVVKPSVVLYGEPLDKYVCIGARREIAGADTLIVAGTSLSVEPAASFLESFEGRSLVVINREPTPADRRASLVLRGDVARILSAVRVPHGRG